MIPFVFAGNLAIPAPVPPAYVCRKAVLDWIDVNADRVRVTLWCNRCGRLWHGCFAKRLAEDGQAAWGPPGEWRFGREPQVDPLRVACTEWFV